MRCRRPGLLAQGGHAADVDADGRVLFQVGAQHLAEREAEGDDFHRFRDFIDRAERQGGQVLDAVGPHQGQVEFLVGADDLGLDDLLRLEARVENDGNGVEAGHDVLVGDEQAGRVDAEAGAAAVAVLDVDGGGLADLAQVGAGQAFVGRPGGRGEDRGGRQAQGIRDETHGESPQLVKALRAPGSVSKVDAGLAVGQGN